MHSTVQILKNNNNSSVVIMIFLLIFTSVFLTHIANFCNLKGFRIKFSVCLILPYPSASITAGCSVGPTLIAVPGSSERSCGRCTQAEELLSFGTELQEEVGRLRCIEESQRLLKLHPVFSQTEHNRQTHRFPVLSLPGKTE